MYNSYGEKYPFVVYENAKDCFEKLENFKEKISSFRQISSRDGLIYKYGKKAKKMAVLVCFVFSTESAETIEKCLKKI